LSTRFGAHSLERGQQMDAERTGMTTRRMDARLRGHDMISEQDATGGLDEIADRDAIHRYDSGPRLRQSAVLHCAVSQE